MQISSFPNSLQKPGAPTKQLSASSTDFAKLVASRNQDQDAQGVRLPEGSRPAPSSKPDFKSMTPGEFKSQAQVMYNAGEIDITTLGIMQLSANVPDDNGSPATSALDFTSIIKSRMDFETQSGHRNSPISSYKIYENIYSRMNQASGVNHVG